jgi:hypothetical protein
MPIDLDALRYADWFRRIEASVYRLTYVLMFEDYLVLAINA